MNHASPKCLSVLSFALFAGLGCSQEHPVPSPNTAPAPNPSASPAQPGGGGSSAYLQLEPLDRSTNLGSLIAPAVVVEGSLETIAKIDRALFEASVTLVTWPESTVVGSKKTTAFDSSTGRLTVTIVPTDTLGDQWYAISVDKVPSGVSLAERPGYISKDGKALSRFRRDSAPTIANLTLCHKGGNTYTVYAMLSERAKATGAFKLGYDDQGTGMVCTPPPALPPSADGKPTGDTVNSFEATCEVETARALKFDVPTLVSGASSSALGFKIAPAALVPFGKTCRIWRPE